MKYKVTIRRKEYREHVFEVDAKSRAEAEGLAVEASWDHDFGQDRVDHAEEEVISIAEEQVDREIEGLRCGFISQSTLPPIVMEGLIQGSRDLRREAAAAGYKDRLRDAVNSGNVRNWLQNSLKDLQPHAAALGAMEAIARGQICDLETKVAAMWEVIEQSFNDQYKCDDREWFYEKDGYVLSECLRNSVSVIKSPYYTYAQTHVPGAGDLDKPMDIVISHQWGMSEDRPYPHLLVTYAQEEVRERRIVWLRTPGVFDPYGDDVPFTVFSNQQIVDIDVLPKTYCLGYEWFDRGVCILTSAVGEDPDDCTTHAHEPGAPYPIFSVETGKLVTE